MPTNAALTEDRQSRASEATLREVVEALAPLEREAGSEGERAAAEWLAARLNQAGAAATIDEEEFLDGYAGLHARLSAAGAGAGLHALSGRGRRAAAAGGAAAAALIADDASNGLRPARRALAERKTTGTVLA
ncbi:MAG: hypothetical protein ACHQJ5_10035 [Vicinamibacteria bacterium]